MRGRPWLRLLLVLLAFAILAVPVWRLTRTNSAVTDDNGARLEPSARAKTGESESELAVSVDFVPPPRDFQLQHLGRTLLEGRGPTSSFAITWRVVLPKEGADLTLRAAWPENGHLPAAAARLRVTLPDGRTVEKTFWAQTAGDNRSPSSTPPALVEVFTVPGDEQQPAAVR